MQEERAHFFSLSVAITAKKEQRPKYRSTPTNWVSTEVVEFQLFQVYAIGLESSQPIHIKVTVNVEPMNMEIGTGRGGSPNRRPCFCMWSLGSPIFS